MQEIHVTNLNDLGPGSFRDALLTPGSREIHFDVAGVINLESKAQTGEGDVWIRGDTAPDPGITLQCDGLRFATAATDVVVEHLRIHVGDKLTNSSPDNRDGIDIGSQRVTIRNCSIYWAIDGLLDVWNTTTVNPSDVTIEDCILAECLYDSIHPEGPHSTAVLFSKNNKNFNLRRNLIAHCNNRFPAVHSGCEGNIYNNLMYNPRGKLTEMYYTEGADPTLVNIIGNHVIGGANTKTDYYPVIERGLIAGSELYYSDNLLEDIDTYDPTETIPIGEPGEGTNPISEITPAYTLPIDVVPSSEVAGRVLGQSGARPWDRDEQDKRLVNEVLTRTGSLRDTPDLYVDPLSPGEALQKQVDDADSAIAVLQAQVNDIQGAQYSTDISVDSVEQRTDTLELQVDSLQNQLDRLDPFLKLNYNFLLPSGSTMEDAST